MNKYLIKRFVVMVIGLIILGLGIAIFKISLMGNDPHTAMVMALGDKSGIGFSIMLIIVNCIWFVAQILFGRKHIGIGTFFNWFGVGFISSFWINFINGLFTISQALFPRILIMVIGVLILGLGASMYQTSMLGIAPYDVISIILSEQTPVPYFWCRVFTDSVCAVITFTLGGLIGPGTLVCALGLGPFIVFFNHHVSEKLCRE